MRAGADDQAEGELRRHMIVHAITESHPFGGAQRNTLLTLQGLLRRGYRVELVCGPGGRLITEARAAGVEVHVLDDLVRTPHPVQDFRTLWRLYSLFRARDYRIVHTHSTKAGLLGRVAARLAGVPVVVHTFHGFPFQMTGDWRSRLYTGMERVAAIKTDRIVCVGEILRQQMRQLRMAPAQKLVTVYSALDFGTYRTHREALETKRLLGVKGAWPIVGSVGHLVKRKAQHYLIETIALLRPKYPRIMLLIAGEGPMRSRLEQRVRDLDVAAHVRLLGERDDIADLLGILDVYAMSSAAEGVGRALCEAMYWGLPVVMTDVDGASELVVNEETGLLVSPHDPQGLAAAIDRLACDVELGRRLGTAARRKVRELMDLDRMVDDLIRLYGALMASKPAPTDLPIGETLRKIG